jgi:hypothetical protein
MVRAVFSSRYGVDLDPHRLVEVDPDAAKDVDELRVGADAGAATGEVVGIALEHDRIAAHAAQEMRRQQSAERATDHQGTSRRHDFSAPDAFTPSPTPCCRGPACNRGCSAPGCG